MATPHIKAQPGDFTTTVVMPGDPLRAKYIADNFLTDAVCINQVRNILAYRGHYQGKDISVMASGMGIPSMSIYANELYSEFGVEQIIRIGSCGALQDDLALGDLVLAQGCSTDSNVNRQRFCQYDFAALADFDLLCALKACADKLGKSIQIGNVFTTDSFYHSAPESYQVAKKLGVLAVEMETAGLYGVAADHGKKAVAMYTVSDHIFTGELMDADSRETAFLDMMEIAMELA